MPVLTTWYDHSLDCPTFVCDCGRWRYWDFSDRLDQLNDYVIIIANHYLEDHYCDYSVVHQWVVDNWR